jgi:four helix bundle protein
MPRKKPFDLDLRTRSFAKKVRAFVKALPLAIAKSDDAKQLLRSSGSVGANFIEAAEGFSAKDRLHKMKICRKESKESGYWLDLLEIPEILGLDRVRMDLMNEAGQLTRIFGKIVNNGENPPGD